MNYISGLIILLLFLGFELKADELDRNVKGFQISGHLQTRYDHQTGRDIVRLQDAIAVRLKGRFSKRFRIEGFIQNNPNYGVKYHTYYNHLEKNWLFDDQKFAFKQLFLSYNINSFSFFLGALNATDQFGGHTSFGANSWVDGLRGVFAENDGYKLSITVGSLNDLNSEILSRERVLNYVELYLFYKTKAKLFIETSVGAIVDEKFSRFASRKDFKIIDNRTIRLETEVLINIKNSENQLSTAISGAADMFDLIDGTQLNNSIELKLQYSYGDPEIGLRGQVNDDRYMDDYNFQFSLSKYLGQSKSMKIESIVDFRKDNRYQLSFRYDF